MRVTRTGREVDAVASPPALTGGKGVQTSLGSWRAIGREWRTGVPTSIDSGKLGVRPRMWGGPMTREIERCGRRSKTAVAGFGATGKPVRRQLGAWGVVEP